jgi:hypothetical protein
MERQFVGSRVVAAARNIGRDSFACVLGYGLRRDFRHRVIDPAEELE